MNQFLKKFKFDKRRKNKNRDINKEKYIVAHLSHLIIQNLV